MQGDVYKTEAGGPLSHGTPPAVGHTQAVDFEVVGEKGDRKKFLVLVDILSVYSEVFWFVLPPTSTTIINKLTDFWNSTGWPVVFCSD